MFVGTCNAKEYHLHFFVVAVHCPQPVAYLCVMLKVVTKSQGELNLVAICNEKCSDSSGSLVFRGNNFSMHKNFNAIDTNFSKRNDVKERPKYIVPWSILTKFV